MTPSQNDAPKSAPLDDRDLLCLRQNLRSALTQMVQAFGKLSPETLAEPARIRRTLAASEALIQLLDQLPDEVRLQPIQGPIVLKTDIFLADLKSGWGARLREAGLRFQILASPNLPRILELDPLLLDQIWAATLGNVAHNARADRVTIRLGTLSDQMLQISIQHEGGRVENLAAGALQTLRDLVASQGGSIDASNRPIRGTLLLVSLPLLPSPPKPAVLPSPPKHLINSAQFASLLKMAGPEGAAEILLHFQSDLSRVAKDLTTATKATDWPVIRAQTHILIALAGTAGAEQLSKSAQAMNTLAHDAQAKSKALLEILPQLLESLSELQQFIRIKLQETGLEQ